MTKRPSLAGNVKPSKLAESMKPLAQDTAPDPVGLFEKAQVDDSRKAPTPSAKRYEGMKKMLIPLAPDVHRSLKVLAAQKDMTLEKIVQEAVNHYILSSK